MIWMHKKLLHAKSFSEMTVFIARDIVSKFEK